MNKIAKNFIYSIIYHIVSMIVPLIVNPYITRTISQDLLGENAYIAAQITYFCILGTLGMNTLGTREIAHISAKGQENVRERFYSLVHLQFAVYGFILIAYVGYLLIFPDHLNLKIIYLLMILSSMTDINWLYMGLEKFKFISIRNCLLRLISTALVFLFVKKETDINLYVICMYAPQLVLNAMMWAFAKKQIGKDSREYKIQRTDIKNNLILAVPGIAISVYTILDKFVIGLFQPAASVAIYDQGQALIRIALSVVMAFGTVVMPRISGMIGNADDEAIRMTIKKCAKFVWLLSVGLLFGMLGIARIFVSWYLPDNYSYVADVIMITSPIVLISSAENIMGVQVLIPHGGEKQYSISLVTAAIINLILDLIFVPKYGIIAACICSVIAEGIALILQSYYCRKYIKISDIYKEIWFYLFIGLLMYFVIHYVEQYITIGPQIKTIILSGLGIAIYLGLCGIRKFISTIRK